MKDKLRELAERWATNEGDITPYIMGRRDTMHNCADELLSILDAEGDGGAVGDAKEYLDNCVNALDHIARTARNCRVTSKRLTWIASRAESAINSNDSWRDAPVPKNGASALLRAQARIKELEAELSHPARSGVVSDEDVALLKGIETLCGFVQNGSDTVVKLFQDDATRVWFCKVGNKDYWAPSFRGAINAAIQGERHE